VVKQLAGAHGFKDGLHHAGQSLGERLLRVVQWRGAR
jgi:hypothetical protein